MNFSCKVINFLEAPKTFECEGHSRLAEKRQYFAHVDHIEEFGKVVPFSVYASVYGHSVMNCVMAILH